MQRYSQETKELIHEYHLYGHSNRSIAKLLGISKSGVARHLLSLQASEKQRLRELTQPEVTHTAHRLEGPKILFFDLETAAALAYAFGRRKQFISQDAIHQEGGWILTAAWKWMGQETETYSNIEEIIKGSDLSVCEKMHALFSQADAVIAHNCVEINTPILKADMTWVKACDLKVGDELVGFDEGRPPGTNPRENGKWKGVQLDTNARQVKKSIVEDFSIQDKPCVEVLLSNGDTVITTKDHYWLGKAEKDNNLRWYKSENLRPGQRFNKFLNVYTKDLSYESGWLSGFMDSEGCVSKSRGGSPTSIQICQNPNPTWDRALQYISDLGFKYAKPCLKEGGLGRGETLYTNIRGGRWKVVELIGKTDAVRLKTKVDWDKFGVLSGGDQVKVVSVKDVGVRSVVVMGTSTSTFIANGYPMHNCKNFDMKVLETRMLQNGLPPLPYVQTIDTLDMARKQYRFPSNKLDSLGDILGVGRKVSHSGISLWKDVQSGDKEALKKMLEYNKQDVDLLSDVYFALCQRGLVSSFNAALYYDDDEMRCRVCGSTDLNFTGRKVPVGLNVYEEVTCNSCLAVQRTRQSSIGKAKRDNLLMSV